MYQRSTRTLRFASAGHPPALLFTRGPQGLTVSELSTEGMPVGMFAGFDFPCATATVAPGSQLVITTDGAYELRTGDGREWSRDDFIALCTRLAASPEWSPDTLIDLLRARIESEVFEDDVSVVKATF